MILYFHIWVWLGDGTNDFSLLTSSGLFQNLSYRHSVWDRCWKLFHGKKSSSKLHSSNTNAPNAVSLNYLSVTFRYFIVQFYIAASHILFNWLFLTACVKIVNHNSTRMVAWEQLIINNSLCVDAHINYMQGAVAAPVIDCFGGSYVKGSGSCCHQAALSILVFKTGNLLFTSRYLFCKTWISLVRSKIPC